MNLSACSTALTLGLHASLCKPCLVYRYNGSFNIIGWNDWIGGLDRTHLPVNTASYRFLGAKLEKTTSLSLSTCLQPWSSTSTISRTDDVSPLKATRDNLRLAAWNLGSSPVDRLVALTKSLQRTQLSGQHSRFQAARVQIVQFHKCKLRSEEHNRWEIGIPALSSQTEYILI